jgi:O-antigen/teichoic acid export membrane protein
MGLMTTLSKHVAEYHALKDVEGLGSLINTGIVLYLGLASLLSGILWLSSSFLISLLFRGSPASTQELQTLWRYLIMLVFANTVTMLFSSVIVGLQRMDWSTAINSFNLLCSAAFAVVLLQLNWGLRGAVYGYVLSGWITLFISMYVVRRLIPEVNLNVFQFRLAVSKEIFNFSVQTYVTQLAVVIHNQVEKLYLARFVGVSAVSWYDIPSDLALKLRGIPSFVLAPVMPAASELHALSDRERLKQLYYRAHKYLAVIGVPLVAYVIFSASDFVRLWVGPALGVIAVPLAVLLSAGFINLTTGPGLLILVGGRKLRPGLYSSVLGIVLNVVVSLFLIRSYGFRGAVIGTSLSLTIASLFFLYMFRRETGKLFPKVARIAYLKPIISSIGGIAVIWVLARTETVSWSKLVVNGFVFGMVYIVSLLLLHFFDTSDLTMIERYFPIPRIARRLIPDAELGFALLPDSESAQRRAG